MSYEFFCGIPLVVLIVLALVFGLFIKLEQMEDWAAVQMKKNRERVSDIDGIPSP